MKYFNLTTPQKNIWNLQTYYDNTAIANICGTVLFQEKRDTALLKEAINYVIKKHTALRLQFTKVNGEIKQYVKEYSYIDIPTIQFTDEAELENYANEAAFSPIGLSEHEMYRFAIVSIGDKQGILATLSHLIADAWTFSLIINEVDKAYRNISEGIENNPDSADYTSFIQSEADYFSSPKYKKDEIYWQEKYALRPERTSVKPGTSSSASVSAKRLVKKLPTPLSKGIQLYCKNNSVTPAVLFETALSCYLFRINPDNHTTTIGLPILNRTNIHEQKAAGMFISTLPLTIDLCENDTVKQLFDKITEAHFQLFRHQKYPYNMILENLRKKQNFEGNLYDVMFSFQNAKSDTASATKWYSNGYSEVPFTLHVDNRDSSDTYTLTVDYQTEIFKDDKEVYDIINRLEYILEQILENTDICIKDISILPDSEKLRLLSEFNNTKVDYPRDKCVHELFTEQAEKTPDAVAVVFEDHENTYKELDEMSNVLAHILRGKGVTRGDIVPIIAQRNWHIIVAMLGILKAGAGYMPIAPDYPKDRIQFIINEAKSKVGCVLGYEEQLDGIELLNLDEISFENASADKKLPLENINKAEDVCYVIFTSGSTGVPKGIALPHKTITNLIHWQQYSGVLNNSKNILSFTSIIFDVFTQEVFSSILCGLTLVLISDEKRNNFKNFKKYVNDKNADTLYCTPSYYNTITKEEKLNFSKVILAGEMFYVNKNVQIPSVSYFNQYGPAETHVVSCANIKDFDDITIGKPIANTQIYMLDKQKNPVPIGIPGELCIAGDGVGLGYLNRPDLTAERFVPNPFATDENGHGKIMYHTGDLAAWRENGDIEYLGRIDTQVKIKGLRIELGEIESIMAEFLGIRMCAVTDKKDDAGRQYLVGYYTTASSEDNTQEAPCIDERSLRQHLQSKLPKYMVPNYFMHLPQMPMTPSGKTDRKNLPTPELITNDKELKLPQNDVEARILSIWKEELHIEKLGCNQDFFEVGGDSLLAIGLLTCLEKEFGARLQMKDLFENRTVEQLATKINDCQATVSSIAISKKDVFLLTPQQRSIYLATQKAPDTLLYNMPAFIRLPNTIDRNRLVTAIQKVFDNFQILRMHVKLDGNGLRGIIDHSCKLNIENYPEDARNAFIRPFNLMHAPLFRVAFSEDYLLIDMHHIISDGTSLQLIINALQAAYENGECIPETAAYSDYSEYLVNYLKSEKTEQGLLWYSENLSTVSKAITFPKPGNKSAYEGANYYYKLTETTKAIEKAICNRYKITSTMLHMAAYALLLKTYSGFDNVSGSIVVTNRQHFETNNTLGMFVNTLPLAWSFESRQTVEEYLTLCKEKLLKIYEYEKIPFATILENVPNTNATFYNTSFVYQASPIKSIRLSETEIAPEFADTHTAKFDLTIEITPDLTGDYLRLEYRTAIIDEQLAERMARSYENILLCLAEKVYVDEITTLAEEEEQKVLYEFNNTKVVYPRDKCVHELFTEQAKKTPDAVAVVFENREISYKELDETSNVLAHILREKGVTRGNIVPIIAQRNWHIIAAMLGILKAGAGYMPIAPDYPKDRVQFIVNEAKSKVGCVLGYEKELEGIELIKLDEISFDNAATNEKLPLENINKVEDVCYVIFTSGSTGVPKGVMIKHKNVTNYCHNNNNNVCHAIIKEGYKKIISVTNFVFDIFVTESILPLLNGMSIYFTNNEEVFSQSAINRIITENAVEVLQTTPTKMKGYLFDNTQKEYLATLKVIILGGEALTVGLYEELKKQTTATIFNIYGPAETTVWSSNARVDNTDITIGKPIANTQIYILDKQQNPVPIGVPGELCIAGDGVGLGYLNRPDLTAERFVPNPFATDENGHGKTMYHTGDLAAWRENGEIEYLGRIDTQVKIRGLRIELGEIESVMAEFPGIRMCAVTDKKDDAGRQYLVGYYTTAPNETTALTSEEKQKVLYEFNNTKIDYPRDKCVHELFTAQAKKTPDAIALIFSGKKYTYKELDELSNGLALSLRKQGIKKGDYIGALLNRDEKIIITQLAVLKLGARFIPIDNRYPIERIKYILDNSNTQVLIKNSENHLPYKRSIDIESLSIERINTLPLEEINPEETCYIIFTSGSTGNPKGCTLTNRGLVNFCKNNNILKACNDLTKQITVSVNTISFDYFIAESLLPLINGYTIVLASEEESINQEKFIELVVTNNVNIIQTTPTRYKIFFNKKRDISFINQFDIFVSSGEPLTLDLLKTLCLNKKAKIFNPLGPSECSVWAVGGELHLETDINEDTITIGKPIANTQIYILDKQQNPVPIGIPGELCIAGEGVGLGYLNRPDLTAERFVPNPFATDENGHGKIMYHTGDLAAWRENGEIEYLGRIDTQVKIRGLRIELGEIESVMAEFPGIHMCAVTDKKDTDDRQFLVGYYTTEANENDNQNTVNSANIDERSLRQHLQSKLPKYMVPNYFMHLSQMPMTPSGKTDRKNLPTPVIKSEDLSEYVAPITEQECKLCEIIEEILHYSPIGLTHDFFSCGGDSLKAMEFIVLAESEGYKFKLQDIFEHPTAKELVEILQEGNNHVQAPATYTADEFTKYAPILSKNIVADDYCVSETPIQSVFLSGITGFLGAHIADALLQDTDCVIYCLIRDTKDCDATERLSQILKYYFDDKYADTIGTRIISVIGDITNEDLSTELPDKVDMIIHSAATVKHYGSYDYFYKVNSLGTKHMTDYALRIGARFIHISTISVSGNSLADSFDTEVALEERYFTETSLYQEQSLSNVYVRSKFEAECVVLDAMLNGLQANIIRVGNLTNRSKDYVFQPNYSENAFLSRIKAGLELGCLPDNILPLYSEFSPIDDTADAIVRIAKHFNTNYTIFHAYSNKNLYFDRLLEILKELSIDMNVVDGETFAKQLKATVNQNKTYIYEAFLNDIGTDGKLNYETNIHIQNDFTLSYLKKLGFEWPLIDYEYIKGYIEYFKKLGYLEVNTNEN